MYAKILALVLLAAGMFIYPQEVLLAASNGLSLWWRFVLPALLPFFILSELLMAQGFVHFLGIILEPLMRPLFRLPGKASFVVAMSYTSGIPIGATLTTRLRQQGDLTREEGERLLAFTCNPSPGFMFGAVASGMLGKPSLGILLAGSVYIANIIVGLLFRFYRVNSAATPQSQKISLNRAWQEMKTAQQRDSRPFGQLLGDAIKQSVTTVLIVGGFMAFFAVVIGLLSRLHFTVFLSTVLNPLIPSLQPGQLEALITGLLETTLGCQSSILAFSTLNQQVAVLAFFMGWGGLSVFAQVASFTGGTDLRFSAFVIGRSLHAFIAMFLSQIFLTFSEIPVSQTLPSIPTTVELWLDTLHLSSLAFAGTLSLLLALGLGHFLFHRFKRYF